MQKGELLHLILSMVMGVSLSFLIHMSLDPFLSYYGVSDFHLFLLFLPLSLIYILRLRVSLPRAIFVSLYLSFILAFPAGRHIFFSSLYYRLLLKRSWEESLRKGFIAGVIALFIFAVSCYSLLTLFFLSSGGRSW